MGKSKLDAARPAPKAKGKAAAGAKVDVESKKAEEARKKEALHGDVQRMAVLENCQVTGVLSTREISRDVRIEQVTIALHGRGLIEDATLVLNAGRRYGLIGANGSGKSTLLAALASRELPIPDHIDMWHVHMEAEPEDIKALDAVVDVARVEFHRLEELALKLAEDPEGNSDLLEAVGDKLDKMDPAMFESRAGELLTGLGFTNEMQAKATKDMSGGWRMRVALAQALFKQPTLLLLDEPTNHLDLGACVWFEEYLASYPSTVILISHSEDFLNGVCTEIMEINMDQKLVYWAGNYDSYVKTRAELEVNQGKAYEKEQTDIKHLQEFIRSCGTYSNMRRQADSKQKIIDKMVEKGLTPKVKEDPKYTFSFPDTEKLAPPVLQFIDVSFSYSGRIQDYLYTGVSLGVDQDSRIALVGPNGAGKSTLLKLMRGDLSPCDGDVKKHGHLRMASYNQHSAEVLPDDKTPLEFMQEKYAEGIVSASGTKVLTLEEWRGVLGKYGVRGNMQTQKIGTMSDGLKSRLIFVLMSLCNPHLLLLDEPTNHLDMQCIDALASAINGFEGGMVLVSHDFRLIDQVAKEVWLCDHKNIKPWPGNIKSYKEHLANDMRKLAKKRAKELEKKR